MGICGLFHPCSWSYGPYNWWLQGPTMYIQDAYMIYRYVMCIFFTPRNKIGPGLPRSTTKSLVKSSVRFRKKNPLDSQAGKTWSKKFPGISWVLRKTLLHSGSWKCSFRAWEPKCLFFLQQHQERQEGNKQPLLLDILRPRHEGRARRRNRWWLDP